MRRRLLSWPRTFEANKEISMPRYVVDRTFPDGLEIPITSAGAAACQEVIESNLEDDVSWVHTYVSTDKKRTWCIYDAPTPDAIRRAAQARSARTPSGDAIAGAPDAARAARRARPA